MRILLAYSWLEQFGPQKNSLKKTTNADLRHYRGGCFRNLVLLKLAYLQQTKWLILYLPHFRTAKTISASNILNIIGLC